MPDTKRIWFMGCPFDSVTEEQAIEKCLQWSRQRRRSNLLITVNVAILMMMRRNRNLREACTKGELVVADGVPIVWATRLLGNRLAGRVCGCDLVARILSDGEKHGLRVFFLGAKEEVVTKLVEIVRRKYPGIVVAGYRNGYFSEGRCDEVTRQVRQSNAPTPLKEVWCHGHREELCTPTILGVGGSFDVLAGYVARSPRWMQQMGLEWFWRFLMEPRRMWKRYLTANTLFICLYLRMLVSRAISVGRPAA
jgi:N-acetylglucosaminyldiphosphoundecaprenol N-acetyl-beta-D-mannosaminyltransferase